MLPARAYTSVMHITDAQPFNPTQHTVDVVIVGGGPGGLQAALTLGRARRDVVLFDAGPPRNARAVHLQNFVTRDGTPPREFRRLAHEELAHYPTVQRVDARVASIAGAIDAFVVVDSGGHRLQARRVFLALGVIDELPALLGLDDIWGISSAQCPFCHGYEVRDRRLLTWAPNAMLLEHASMLLNWSSDLVALTNGADFVDDSIRTHAAASGLVLEERPIARLESNAGQLTRVVFTDGSARDADFLFLQTKQHQTPLVQALVGSHGLKLDEQGFIVVDDFKQTNIAGVFAFGDCTTRMQAAINASAGGMMAAAVAIRGAAPSTHRAASRGSAKTSG